MEEEDDDEEAEAGDDEEGRGFFERGVDPASISAAGTVAAVGADDNVGGRAKGGKSVQEVREKVEGGKWRGHGTRGVTPLLVQRKLGSAAR